MKSFQEMLSRKRCLTGSMLKIFAILCMAIDHFAASILYYDVLLPAAPIVAGSAAMTWYRIYRAMRFIGRWAFPIFCFLLVEGFVYTSSRAKYAGRLLLFALLSEFPFDWALFRTNLTWEYQNVYFTLLIGLCVLWCMELARGRAGKIWPLLWAAAVGCGCLLAWAMKTDYDYKGVILIVILYVFRAHPGLRALAGCISLYWEAPACIAFLPISLYNGKRGWRLKYFFYCFYPAHLLLYGILMRLI